ncbi:clathrin coat assembly protein, putative [Trypanosoma brucei brucei TREU927]|uniref:Clathrin coat assembly protein, putative n=1 Tax=Trypanosoma brucei brucei (strain 927/4 GUTat10.1) TaxID=185431 RepID=Q385T8_TRYB2|nr:clathrin coat assembly protein, putative [Trypanosoma brucei brucei TREU927]EAN79443.1 clathrin coat assembly protein, putative [Trypanosoma brucei brucei TREU927]
MNSKDTNELKRGAGYLKEKAIIGLTRVTGNELDRAIYKVTSHKLKAPKEKHMQRVLAATRGYSSQKTHKGRNTCEYIVSEFEKRLHTHNWIVVLKTLVTFHRLMKDGSDEVNNCIQQNRNIFCFRNIKDLSESSEGAVQSVFIRQYMYYLEERSSSQRKLGASKRMENSEFGVFLRSLDVDTLGPVFESLLVQLSALVEVQYKEAIVDNFCTMEAFQRLVNDGKLLYQILSDRAIFILDGFSGFTLQQKKDWVRRYREYTVVGERLRLLFESIANSKRMFDEPPPPLKALPGSLLESLEREVRLSSIAHEDITETLESLGITADEKTPLKATTSDGTMAIYSPVATEKALDTTETGAPPVTEPKKESGFSIDDLFVPPPVTDSHQQTSYNPSTIPQGTQMEGPLIQTEANPNMTYTFPTGVPVGQNFFGQQPTGNSLTWEAPSPAPGSMQPQSAAGIVPSWSDSSASWGRGNCGSNTVDPFKDLYASQKGGQ